MFIYFHFTKPIIIFQFLFHYIKFYRKNNIIIISIYLNYK